MDAHGTPEALSQNSSQEPPEFDENADVQPELLDPNDSSRLQNQIRGQTTEHASPPRLEDEGQSGG